MKDLIYRHQAIDALRKEWDGALVAGITASEILSDSEDAIDGVPSARPEYEPVKLEDFAKTMSGNTLYSFLAWYGEALELMKGFGFVICKKTM